MIISTFLPDSVEKFIYLDTAMAHATEQVRDSTWTARVYMNGQSEFEVVIGVQRVMPADALHIATVWMNMGAPNELPYVDTKFFI